MADFVYDVGQPVEFLFPDGIWRPGKIWLRWADNGPDGQSYSIEGPDPEYGDGEIWEVRHATLDHIRWVREQ